MAKQKTQISQVLELMQEILPTHPDGIRMKDLHKEIVGRIEGAPIVRATISKLTKDHPDKFTKEKMAGEFPKYYPQLKKSVQSTHTQDSLKAKPSKSRNEEEFYPSFAEYLQISEDEEKKTLDICTNAIPLGNNGFKDYWGTPDVIGLYKAQEWDTVKFPTEVISAEIKLKSAKDELMVAFGQACAYRLFSHRVYLVIPDKPEQHIPRIQALCHLHGIGLVLFDANADKINASIYQFVLLAQRQHPNMNYVNKYLERIKDKLS